MGRLKLKISQFSSHSDDCAGCYKADARAAVSTEGYDFRYKFQDQNSSLMKFFSAF